MKEWLCLNCQMKRALGEAQPPGDGSVNTQMLTKPQKKDSISPLEQEKKESSAPQSPQRKLSVTAQPAAAEGANKRENQKQANPVPSQKMPQEPEKTTGLSKSPDPARRPERKQSDATAVTQQESGGFFGFGGGKTQASAAKPAESGSGKMFGFGSSIFSSASTLITSAVQDQPKTTPPVSPKMSPAKQLKSPAAQRKEDQIKPEKPQQIMTPPSTKAKLDKAASELPKAGAGSQVAEKPGQSTCPLCKVGLNIGSKDLPNYNACTECKNNVCNQCGFNPTPNDTGVRIEQK